MLYFKKPKIGKIIVYGFTKTMPKEL